MKNITIDFSETSAMKGTIDLNHYCPKCESNEFHSCIGTSCAHCGHEQDVFPSTTWNGMSQPQKEHMLGKYNYLDLNFSPYLVSPSETYSKQVKILEAYERRNPLD